MLTMRIYFYCQLVVIAAILALTPSTVKADYHSKPTHRKLKSASELDYPPFALVRPDGSADGFSVDLLKAVTQAVGLDVNFSVGPWHEIKQKLEEGHLDVLPLVAYAQERDKMFDFTVPYLRMHGTIFVREGEKSIHSKEDLKGKEVMVMRSDAAHEYVVRENLSNKLVLTDSFEEAMKLLSEGKHDAVVVQQLVGLQLIKKLGISNVVDVSTFQKTSLKPFGKPLSGFEQKFCFAVLDGDRELLALLNEGLAIVSANGTYNELYNKWFRPILPQPPIPLTSILKYLLFILGPILFFIAIVGLWYLKREVLKKTQSLREEIKERKQVEDTLRESEQSYRNLVETSQDMIWKCDSDGCFTYVNSAWEGILGYKVDEMLGRSFTEFKPPEIGERGLEVFKNALKGSETFGYETIYTAKNGEQKNLVFNIRTLKDANGNTIGTQGTAYDITERKRAEEQIKASLREKEVLLSEIHHRVKNNMQVISSLLRLQAANIEDKKYVAMLKDSQVRIRSMSLVHETLYQSKDFANVDFRRYLKPLVNNLFRAYGIDTNRIQAKIEVEEVSIPIDSAVPCGLLVNELVSNAFKYAFPDDRAGEIRVVLRSINEDELELIVSDDGIGMPEGLDIKDTKSFGMELISILAEDQLGGKMEIDRTGGTKYQIRFKNKMYRPRI